MTLFLLTIAAIASAILSAIAGMGGGILLLSIMTFFLDLAVIVPIHGVVQLVSNSARTLSLIKSVEKRILIPSVLGLPIGTYASTFVIRSIANKDLFYVLIAALIFYVLFKPKKLPKLNIPFWSFGLLGLVVGFLNPIVGSTGPLMAPFYLRDDLTKEQIIATKAATQMIGHLLKIPAFLVLGFDYLKYSPLLAGMVLGVIVGTRIGIKILKDIKENNFRLIFRSALFIAAIRLLYKAFISL